VWPETMFRERLITFDANSRKPANLPDTEESFQAKLRKWHDNACSDMADLATALHSPVILGIDIEHAGLGDVDTFNSALYIARDGQLLGRYDKMHPVVFGEYVPLVSYFPWLKHLLPLPVSLTAGTEPAAFNVHDVALAPNICYETVLPHVIRGQVNALRSRGVDPAALVNLTNDGWYWGSSELDLHLACGVFRAVECRKPLLVAANTGISAWIDAKGQILAQGPRRATDTLLAEVRAEQRDSWYLDHGDWFAGTCLTACGVFAVVGWRRKRG
jgi:apolipoprotein N-acyltransferase